MTALSRYLNQIVENSPGIIFWKDKNFQFLGCNKNFLQFSGYSNNNKIIGKDDFDMSWKLYADKYRKDDEEVISGKEMEVVEYFQNNNNTPMKIYVKKVPLIQDGKIHGLIGYAKVLTVLNKNRGISEKIKVLLSNKIKIGRKLIKEYFSNLSCREAQCLFYLIRGYSQIEIANKLNISSRTIETHLVKIKSKFRVHNKCELIEKAMHDGFYEIIPDGVDEA